MDLHTAYPAISDLRRKARTRIPHFVFEYLDSGTGLEDQVERNQSALRAVRFAPAILKGETTPDLSTRFLGRDYPLPFGMAPVGMSGLMWPGAEKILAGVAAARGIPYNMSTVATVTPETLAPYIGDQGWFQMYMPADPKVRSDMMRRVKAAGFHTLVLTVDVPTESRRERQRRANLNMPPKVNAQMIWQMLIHPLWTVGTLREGIPSLKFCEDYMTKGEDAGTSIAHAGHVIRGAPSWPDIDAIRKEWDGPFIVKGLQKGPDAKRLIDAGVDALWVTNHSGRQFDGGPASISQLPEVRAAAPKTPIIFDSGVTGGLDVLRALALGADFVMLGRAFHFAVAAMGARGVHHAIDILADDMKSNMGQIGAERLADLKDALL